MIQQSEILEKFMAPAETAKPSRSWRLGLALIMLAAIGVRLWYGSFVIDDAYITFRYAHNLVSGVGLVYNPDGRHILGTTTPLYTLLLALPHALGLSLPGISLWYSALSDCLTIGLLFLIGQKLNLRWIGLAAGVLVALWPDYVNYAVSGMETSLYTALLVAAFYLYSRKNFGLTGLTLALLTLTRPDGLLVGVVLFGHYLFKERRLPWRMALAFLPLPALWAAFATAYFGSPISQSLVAKAAGANDTPAESLVQLIIFLCQSVKPGLTILAALGIFAIVRGQFPVLRLPLAWWLLYCAAFVSRSAFHYFPWYYIPLLPFYFLFALAGLAGIGKELGRTLPTGPVQSWLVRGGVALATLGLIWLLVGNREMLANTQSDREELYQQVATEWLTSLPQSEQVAAIEIGTLGYYCNCQMLDLAGLVSPEVLNRPVLEVLQQTRPAYIVIYNNNLRAETLNSDWLKQNYRALQEYEIQWVWGQNRLFVFKRL